MTAAEISEKYNIPLSLLEKMKEDSKSGSFYRQYNQNILNSNYTFIKIEIRNGGEFEASIWSAPVSRTFIPEQ